MYEVETGDTMGASRGQSRRERHGAGIAGGNHPLNHVHTHANSNDAAEPSGTAAPRVTDPVCGMSVGVDSPHHSRHAGNDYFFCSSGCRAKFELEPARYITADRPAKDASAATIYTCPMHPQVRQAGPGSCPICGMALEPLVPSANEDDSELRKVKAKFWLAAALSAPVVAIAMLPHLLDLHLTSA